MSETAPGQADDELVFANALGGFLLSVRREDSGCVTLTTRDDTSARIDPGEAAELGRWLIAAQERPAPEPFPDGCTCLELEDSQRSPDPDCPAHSLRARVMKITRGIALAAQCNEGPVAAAQAQAARELLEALQGEA